MLVIMLSMLLLMLYWRVGAQDVGERDVVKSLAERIEQLLAGSRKGDWIPPEPLPPTHSDWVTALLSYLQVRHPVRQPVGPSRSKR